MAIANLKFKTLQISFIVIDGETLKKLTMRMTELFNDLQIDQQQSGLVEILFEIRSNDEMYSGKDEASFLRVFDDENQAEFFRIIVLKSEASTNAIISRATLHIHKNENSFFEVSGVDENFITSSVEKFKKSLKNAPKRNRIIHSPWTEMAVQLLAVFLIVGLSYYLSNAVFNAYIQIDRVYLFIATFLLFSNIWTYLSRGLLYIRNQFYPKVDIRSKPRPRWIPGLLAFIGTTAGAWLLERLLDMLAKSNTP